MAAAAIAHLVEDNVVLFGAVKRTKAEVGPRPRDAIRAFEVRDGQGAARLDACRNLPGMIVHAVDALARVMKDREVTAPVTIPLRVTHHRQLLRLGGMHENLNILHFPDQMVVDEEFAATANVEQLGIRRMCHPEHQRPQNPQSQRCRVLHVLSAPPVGTSS